MRRIAFLFATITAIGGVFLPYAASASAVTSGNILSTLNAARKTAHVATLRRSVRLELAARFRAESLLRADSLNNGTRARPVTTIVRQIGYSARSTGEVLAADFTTAEDMISAWDYSVVHRKIMYDTRFHDVGIAVLKNHNPSSLGEIVVVILGQNSGL